MCLTSYRGVAERDHLDEGREKHEKERHRVAQDDDELLEKDSAKATEKGVSRQELCFLACHSRAAKTARDLAVAGKGFRERSIHFEFMVSTSAFFLLRRHPLISFSRANRVANVVIGFVVNKMVSRYRFCEASERSILMFPNTRRARSFVTPV